MHTQDRRDRGDGSLALRSTANGREKWVAQWRIDGRGVTRVLGLRWSKTHGDGLTKGEAEAAFKAARAEARLKPTQAKSGRTLHDVGESLKEQMVLDGRRPATLEGLDSTLRIHIVPFFGQESVAKIDEERVKHFNKVLAMKTTRSGQPLSAKSRRNVLVNLHQLFRHAIELKWRTAENPVKGIKKPRSVEAEGTVHALKPVEVEALLQAVPDDVLGQAERPMYLTAAMTGLRQGELFALRWCDVDFTGNALHVEQNYVRNQFQSPKSKKGRSVPMAERVEAELKKLYERTAFKADHDLVFAHPELGTPIDRSKISKRFKATIKRAGVGGFVPVIDPATGQQKRKPKVDPHTNRWVRDEQGVVATEPVTRPVTRFHDLRHTYATQLANSGNFTMLDVQEFMGHADLKTTLIYARYQPKARAAELTSDAFAVKDEPQETPVPSARVSDALAANLRALTELHTAGVLNAEEFAAKAALLAAA